MKDLKSWVNSLVVSLILMTLAIQVNANSYSDEAARIVYTWDDNTAEMIIPKLGADFKSRNLTSRLFILSIGISNYDNPLIKDLPYATKDAKAVYEILDSLKRANNHLYTKERDGEKYLLLDSNATRENILNALQDISEAVNRGDVVMIYLAGHGEKVLNKGTYFMPYGIERNGRPEIYAIGYKQIINHLKELVDMECIPILFVDACYAGDFYERSNADFIGDADPSIIGFYSSTSIQESGELPELEHGIFTYALLKGLRVGAKNGQGNITIRSLADFIEKEVKANLIKYLPGAVQTPKLDNRGEDHYVLFGNLENSEPVAARVENQTAPSAEETADYYSRSRVEEAHSDRPDPILAQAEGYSSGRLQPKTTDEAFEIYMQAAKKNNVKFMCKVADCYAEGYGCEPNLEEAFNWYKKAAEEGLDSAQHKVGKMYYEGDGVPQDIQMAKKWLKEAALKGNVAAQSDLGELLFKNKEYKEALTWLEKASDKEDAKAMFYFGTCYRFGYGVEKDLDKFLFYLKKSAKLGYKEATEMSIFLF